jgi:hypothetical protein
MAAIHEFDGVCYKMQQRTTFGDKLDTVNFDFLTIDDFFYKNYLFYLLKMVLTLNTKLSSFHAPDFKKLLNNFKTTKPLVWSSTREGSRVLDYKTF